MTDPYFEQGSTSITVSQTPPVYTHPSQLPPDPRWKRISDLIATWKIERDAKCYMCREGLPLGRYGCHYDTDSGEESFTAGNCMAWGIAKRIQQLEEAMS
jgi:hypothetical protein